MVSYVLCRGQSQGSTTSQSDCPVYSHKNSMGKGGQTTSYSSSFLLVCCSSRPRSLCQNILHVPIHNTAFDNILWILLMPKFEAKCLWMITHTATPRQTSWWRASSLVCFLEVSGCLKSFPWRSLRGCNWEQMRRPLRASMVMSALVEGKAWQDGCERWRRRGSICREPECLRGGRLSASLQVGRLAAITQTANVEKQFIKKFPCNTS